MALAWLEDFSNARQSFEVALSMQPNLVDTHRFMALVCAPLGEKELAAKHAALADHLLQKLEAADAARAKQGLPEPPPVRIPAWGWQAFEKQMKAKPAA